MNRPQLHQASIHLETAHGFDHPTFVPTAVSTHVCLVRHQEPRRYTFAGFPSGKPAG